MDSSNKDRVEGVGDEVVGTVKEGVGKTTDDEQMQGEGKADQIKGQVKQGVADVKDKASDVIDKVKGN
jgi:uncharacterized protein YjbJ (UPF0337 family)